MEQSRKKKKHTESKLAITICLPNVFFYDTDFMQGGNNMITDLQKQKAIFHHLQAFGIRHHCAGHRYLCTSITLALAHPEYLSEVMEQFYPAVAKKHQRSIGAVESAMRRAIIDAYESGVASDRFLLYFKRSAKEIPSVSEFVSVLATHIRYSLAELDSPSG